ncbi:hypothetical protein EBR25_11370 [bacterium]|nr:hypothetical protein [bacterium]
MYRSKEHVCGTLQGYTNRKLGCGFLSSKDKTQKDQVMRNVRRISSATGASRTTMLVFSFLAAVLIYLCSQAAPALYRYYELESQAVAMARRGSIRSRDPHPPVWTHQATPYPSKSSRHHDLSRPV